MTGLREEVLYEKGPTLVRRLRLEPGQAMRWHTDPFERVSIVLRGDSLEIEYRESGERQRVSVTPGQVGWDEPTHRPHRAVNVGGAYEEVTVFLRDREGVPHQPEA